MPFPNARNAVMVLVLAFPFLMVASSPGGFRGTESILPVAAVEVVLLSGLAFAAAERTRMASPASDDPRPKLGKATRRPLSRLETGRRAGALSVRLK